MGRVTGLEQFFLQNTIDSLGNRIFIALASHANLYLVFLQQDYVFTAAVLNTQVGMAD